MDLDAAGIAQLAKSPMFRDMMGDQADEVEKQMADPKMA